MRRRKQSLLFGIVLLVMALGIGYAYLSTTLSINGVTDVDRNVWDIYFDNIVVSNGSVTGSQVIDAAEVVDDTTVSFHVNLKEPGEYYEFTVDAKNDGTIDAMISSITKKVNNSTTIPAYLRFNVTYSDGIPIAENHLLSAESLETYKVRVEYRTDIDPSDLPTTAQSLTLSFEVEYVQANENAIAVPHPTSFADDDWSTIVLAVQNGNTSAYNVGDTKTVELGNSLGTHTLRIANKSTPSQCSNPSFSQTACGFVVEFEDCIVRRGMNSTDTNVGGWPATSQRTYVNNTIYNALPTTLKDAIIDTRVISSHGTTAGETNFTSTDKLFLLSFMEIYGDDQYSTIGFDQGRQLDYYASIPVTLDAYTGTRKKIDGSYTAYWTRTASGTDLFRIVQSAGGWRIASNASTNYAVCPAFRIG